MKKAIVYLLLLCLVLGIGVNAFASENSSMDVDNKAGKMIALRQKNGGENLEKVLGLLLEEGKFTKEKVDSILSFIEEKRNEMQGQRPMGMKGQRLNGIKGKMQGEVQVERINTIGVQRIGIVEEMVEVGIITEEEANLIREKNNELMPVKKEENLSTMIDVLIEKGIITEAQKDGIVNFCSAKEEERKAEFEKIKTMTEEERKAYFDANKGERKDPIGEMVGAGVITDEQAKELANLMPMHNRPEGDKRFPMGPRQGRETRVK